MPRLPRSTGDPQETHHKENSTTSSLIRIGLLTVIGCLAFSVLRRLKTTQKLPRIPKTAQEQEAAWGPRGAQD
eukprot:241304-Pyramimonas_sp.AAC.1